MALIEYLIEVEFPINVLFGTNLSRYVVKTCLSDLSITLKELLRRLNDELIKSNRFEGYLDGGSGFYVFVNDNLVRDISTPLKELIEPSNKHIKIKILPIFEGG